MAQRNWQGAEFFRFSALMCCQASALGRLLRVDTWTVSVRLHKPRNPGIAGWPGSSGGLVGLCTIGSRSGSMHSKCRYDSERREMF